MADQQNESSGQIAPTINGKPMVLNYLKPPLSLDTLVPRRAPDSPKSQNEGLRSNVTARKSQGFPLFVKLPVELQIMFWNTLEIQPRIIVVTHGCCKYRRMNAVATIPAILQVNAMARHEGLKRLTKIVDGRFRNAFYFNPAKDVLSFISSCDTKDTCRLCEDLVRNFTLPSQKDLEPESLYQITRHVAIAYRCFYRSAIREAWLWPNLRTLAVPLESLQRLRCPPVRPRPHDEYSNYQQLSKIFDFTHIQRTSAGFELLDVPILGTKYIETPHVTAEHRQKRRNASDRKDLILLF